MLKIAFLSPSRHSSLMIRCCSTFARASTAPLPFRNTSKKLTIALSSPYNGVVCYSTASNGSEDISLFPQTQQVPEPKKTSAKQFSSNQLHPSVQKALDEVFQFKDMSIVQEKVLGTLPTQHDMLVRAKTGLKVLMSRYRENSCVSDCRY